jgi:hypothetical protein
MTVFVDLSDVPVVDNHCHAIESQEYADVSAWRQLFTESPDPGMRARDVVETAFYRRLIRAMAAFHDVAVTEDEVLQARARHRVEDLVGKLFRDAAIAGVVIDTGYPANDRVMAESAFTSASGSDYVALQRRS